MQAAQERWNYILTFLFFLSVRRTECICFPRDCVFGLVVVVMVCWPDHRMAFFENDNPELDA